MIILGDIGGTHMRIAISDSPGSFSEPVILDTPATPEAAAHAFAETATRIARGQRAERAIIGVAGLLSPDGATLLTSPNLPAWKGVAITPLFSDALHTPAQMENDAMLGALGEAQYGAGRGAAIVAYVTVGTGVGGARIVNGRIDRHADGFEVGHQRLGADADAPELESLISGSALEARYGKPASEIDDPAVWDKAAGRLALGLYNTILHWSPDVVVLGGSAFYGKKVIPLARVEATLRAAATALPSLPELRLAELGDRSSLYGALALATTEGAPGGSSRTNSGL